MGSAIAYRGPDGEGVWHDPQTGFGLVHRRLAIVDLTDAGHQPMQSRCGRYVLAYNGEIYNHLSIRQELEAAGVAPPWRGHSDTETLVESIAWRGLEQTVRRCSGMFALALWDKHERTLALARDRAGEKPLYYGSAGNSLFFGSELKALARLPGYQPEISRLAIAYFLKYGCVPGPLSIFKGIAKLQPGHIVVSDAGGWSEAELPFWSIGDVILAGRRGSDPSKSFDQRSRELEAILAETVASHLMSDVPLGSFLSGGVDSSLVTALMQRTSKAPVRTFSIAFVDGRFNEAPHAKAIATYLGTQHSEFAVTEADAMALVDRLALFYDEPFADSSALPTILLSQMTRNEVTVALTGDGGDEVFGGYNRYIYGPGLLRWLGTLPESVRGGLGAVAALLQRTTTGRAAAPLAELATRIGLPVTFIDRLGKFGSLARAAGSLDEFYDGTVSHFDDPASVLVDFDDQVGMPWSCDLRTAVESDAEAMMAADFTGYLPDDILVKVDRASMACSLETRAPLLDRRVVEFAWTMPLDVKISGGYGKRILKDVLYRHVPRELIDRPKQGFAVPLDSWLRGGLREWAEWHLSEHALRKGGMLAIGPVRELWKRHLAGTTNAGTQLWSILMLQTWLAKHADKEASAAGPMEG